MQILVFLAPVGLAYLFFRDSRPLPDMNLSSLVFEPAPMLTGALLLIGGFTVFTGVLVAIGRSCRPRRKPGPSSGR